MIVGTANSSIDNIAFYQKLGFRMAEIKRDFFKAYPTPIFENGIRALDMIVFEKELGFLVSVRPLAMWPGFFRMNG